MFWVHNSCFVQAPLSFPYRKQKGRLFGDCIYAYVYTPEDAVIHRDDIIANFNEIFNDNFLLTIKALNNESKNLELHENEGSYKYLVSINNPIKMGKFAKVYWFSKEDKYWAFAGMTCVG